MVDLGEERATHNCVCLEKDLQSALIAFFGDLFVPYTHVLFALHADGTSDRESAN